MKAVKSMRLNSKDYADIVASGDMPAGDTGCDIFLSFNWLVIFQKAGKFTCCLQIFIVNSYRNLNLLIVCKYDGYMFGLP